LQAIGVFEKLEIEANIGVCSLSYESISKEKTNWDKKNPMIYKLKQSAKPKKSKLIITYINRPNCIISISSSIGSVVVTCVPKEKKMLIEFIISL
jgi:hypothetical protein